MAEEQSYCKSIVKKQQQAELCKLPRHHPLVREVHSDDGMQVFLQHFPTGATSPHFLNSISVLVDMSVDVELEQEEKEEWAKPLTWLWQSRPFNPQAEREYNKSMGQQPPYCSICLLFHTHQVTTAVLFYEVLTFVLCHVLLYCNILCSLAHKVWVQQRESMCNTGEPSRGPPVVQTTHPWNVFQHPNQQDNRGWGGTAVQPSHSRRRDQPACQLQTVFSPCAY